MICAFPASNFLIFLIHKRYRGQSGRGSCVPTVVTGGWVRIAAFTIGRHCNGDLERLASCNSPFLYCESRAACSKSNRQLTRRRSSKNRVTHFRRCHLGLLRHAFDFLRSLWRCGLICWSGQRRTCLR